MAALQAQKRTVLSFITMKEEREGCGYHKCTECLRMYEREEELGRHMERKHSLESDLPPPRESYQFQSVIKSKISSRRERVVLENPSMSSPSTASRLPQKVVVILTKDIHSIKPFSH